jgi:hypothetical protein
MRYGAAIGAFLGLLVGFDNGFDLGGVLFCVFGDSAFGAAVGWALSRPRRRKNSPPVPFPNEMPGDKTE